jgi:hypothetical protein
VTHEPPIPQSTDDMQADRHLPSAHISPVEQSLLSEQLWRVAVALPALLLLHAGADTAKSTVKVASRASTLRT